MFRNLITYCLFVTSQYQTIQGLSKESSWFKCYSRDIRGHMRNVIWKYGKNVCERFTLDCSGPLHVKNTSFDATVSPSEPLRVFSLHATPLSSTSAFSSLISFAVETLKRPGFCSFPIEHKHIVQRPSRLRQEAVGGLSKDYKLALMAVSVCFYSKRTEGPFDYIELIKGVSSKGIFDLYRKRKNVLMIVSLSWNLSFDLSLLE